jgi:hypothetical protein
MATALTIHDGGPVVPLPVNTSGLDVMQLGAVLARSGYFKDARDASQAVVKVLYGQEIGIGPVSAMMGVHIIEGKPAPSANLIAARIKSSGRYDYRVREHTADVCRIEFFEVDARRQRESLGTVEWSMEDARRAGLGGRGPWKSYPRAMLFARAISEGARTHCPEIFGGAPVYTPDELGADVDQDGNAIGVETIPTEPSITPEQRNLIENLLRSHVITEDERDRMTARLDTMTLERARQAIDNLTATVRDRKEIERQERAAAGEVIDADTGEVIDAETEPF